MKTKVYIVLILIILSSCLNIKYVDSSESAIHAVKPIEKDSIIFDGLTKKELVNKISRSLNDDLKDKAELYVTYSLEKGVDPYLSVAISLHETGCKWKCSNLVKKCNNVGGMVGRNKCGNSPYNTFKSLDEGIMKFIDNLSENYIKKGLTTPELMNKKYATSKTWAYNVNKYIDELKES